MPEAQRGVEVGDDLAGGQLEQLERGLPRQALQRSAAEVDEPLLLGLRERRGCRAAGRRCARPRAASASASPAVGRAQSSRHANTIEVRLDVIAKPVSLVRSGM